MAITVNANPKRHTPGAISAVERLEQREVRSYEMDHVNALWQIYRSELCRVPTRNRLTSSLQGQRYCT